MTDSRKPHVFWHQGAWRLTSYHVYLPSGMRMWNERTSAPTLRQLQRKMRPGFWPELLRVLVSAAEAHQWKLRTHLDIQAPPKKPNSTWDTALHMRPASAGLQPGQADGPLSNVQTRST